jgi:hypothetical protein
MARMRQLTWSRWLMWSMRILRRMTVRRRRVHDRVEASSRSTIG